jgi:hypothetical protein
LIRVPSADAALGLFDPSETLRKAQLLREKGVKCFTNERGVVIRSEEEIKRFEKERAVPP